jgi:hypothetical protein
VATLLEREFDQEIDRVHGAYGQFRIDVDGREILDAGALAALGIVPSNAKILDAVRDALARPDAPAENT